VLPQQEEALRYSWRKRHEDFSVAFIAIRAKNIVLNPAEKINHYRWINSFDCSTNTPL